MSSETLAKPSYLNFSTRPRINKQKAKKVDLRRWETSLNDFNENSLEPVNFLKPDSYAIYKELSLCNKKSNEIKKNIFCENGSTSLKKISILEKNITEGDFSSTNNNDKPIILQSTSKKKTGSDAVPEKRAPHPPPQFPILKKTSLKRKSIKESINIQTDLPRPQAVMCQSPRKKLLKNVNKERSTHNCHGEGIEEFKDNSIECTKLTRENIKETLVKRPLTALSLNNDFGITKNCTRTSNSIVDQSSMFGEDGGIEEFQDNSIKCTKFSRGNIKDASLRPLSSFNNDVGVAKNCEGRKNEMLAKGNLSVMNEFSRYEISSALLKNDASSTVFSDRRTSNDFKECFKIDAKCERVKNSKHKLSVPMESNQHYVVPSINLSTNEVFKSVKHESTNDIDCLELGKTFVKSELLSLGSLRTPCAGSEWVHSLHQASEELSREEGKKKKIQNLLFGGHCEQLLKFQRRESSEKALYDHRNGSKNTSESLLMKVHSVVLHAQDVVIALCCLIDGKSAPQDGILLEEGRTYVALFRRFSFHKQGLRIGSCFSLSPPWHLIQFKHPVIICKFFKVTSLELSNSTTPLERQYSKQCSAVKYCPQSGRLEDEGTMFSMWKERLKMTARIQRIWTIPKRNSPMLSKNQNVFRLLLQTRDGLFYILSSCQSFLLKFAEEVCLFEDLRVMHRLDQRSYPRLFKYLQSLLKENEEEQHFIYHLGIDELTKMHSEVSEPALPPPLTVLYQPLSAVIKSSNRARVSCRVKVLLQYRSVLYVSDESVLRSGSVQYVKVFFAPELAPSFSGISIKEALISDGVLLLDEYSEVSPWNVPPPLHLGEMPLRRDSSVADVVTVRGNITGVDESSACIWLQCNFCMNENLVQNSEGVIFCEDCGVLVNQPLLRVKMNVTILCETLENILLNVELLSSTIKRILSLEKDSYQPQCSVLDVLGKEIGPLLCHVSHVESEDSHTLFHLDEVVAPPQH